MVSSTGDAFIDCTYSCDQTSNLLAVTDNLVPERSITCAYDDMSSLRSATRQPSTIRSREHDLIGNRRYYGFVKGGVVQPVSEYGYAESGAGPKLVGIRTAQIGQSDVTQGISYDAAGNILEDHISGFTYDLRNHLKLHSDSTWTEDYVSFRYDSHGFRVYSHSEQANGWAIDAYLLPDTLPFVNVTLDATLIEVNEVASVFLGDRLLAQTDHGAILQVISDQISFPFAVIDDPAGLVWHAETDALGRVESVLGGTADGDPLRRFPDQWKLTDCLAGLSPDLFYNTNRWYAPTSARYTQSDPIGLAGGRNPLPYAAQNPLGFSDRSGLFPRPPGGMWCDALTPPTLCRDSNKDRINKPKDRRGRNRRIYCSGGGPTDPRFLGGIEVKTEKEKTTIRAWFIPSGDGCIDFCVCRPEWYKIQGAYAGRTRGLSTVVIECDATEYPLTYMKVYINEIDND